MFIDFNLLASKYPELYSHLYILGHRTVINFKNQKSLIVLTAAIMKCIFNYQWNCPYQNLCPRIPNRVNYLLWVNAHVDYKISFVMDIGTGASLIYPLLGLKIFGWKFMAIDSNGKSIENCKNLVSLNGVEEWIKVMEVKESENVLDFEATENECEKQNANLLNNIDVVICNPPFYDNDEVSEEQSIYYANEQQLNKKQPNNQPVGTMLKQQFSTKGGEYSFFFQMFRQSFNFTLTQNIKSQKSLRVKYFTCLLGRESSFKEVSHLLKYEYDYGVLEQYRLGEIRQGSNARFVVLWRPKIV